MNGAELKTLRELLGLESKWLADQVGVTDRTMRYWESTNQTIKPDVEKKIRSLADLFNQARTQLVGQYLDPNHKGQRFIQKPITLVRYKDPADMIAAHPSLKTLPVTFHAAILGQAKRELKAHSRPCRIVFFDRAAYSTWLAGRSDDPEALSDWAAEQIQ